MPNVNIEIVGFEETERLRFEGVGLRSVSRMFGEAVSIETKVTLNLMFLDMGKVMRMRRL